MKKKKQQQYNIQHDSTGGTSTIPTLCHMLRNDPERPETDSLQNVQRRSPPILPGAPKINQLHQHHVALRGLQITNSGTGDVHQQLRVHTDDGMKSTTNHNSAWREFSVP